MKWDELSMAERAKYIQLGVSNGITDLSVIIDTYNKYQDDIELKDGQYGSYNNPATFKAVQSGRPVEIAVYPDRARTEYVSSDVQENQGYQLDKADARMIDKVKADELVANTSLSPLDLIIPGMTPEDAASMIPLVGDAIDVGTISKDFYDQNYFEAGIGAAMLLFPNLIEKPLKYIGKQAKKLVNHKNSELVDALDEALSSSFYVTVPNSTRTFKEVKSPDVMIHVDRGDSRGAYTKHGSYIEDEQLKPGKAKKSGQRDFTWFNQSEPYTLSMHGEPMERVFIGRHEDISGLTKVRDMYEPVGQWPGKGVKTKSFVKKSEHVTPEPISLNKLIQYNLDPFEYSIGNNLYIKEGQPIMRRYGNYDYAYRDVVNTRQGYITQGKSRHSQKLKTSQHKEDITDLQNPVLRGPVNDVKTTIYESKPKQKEIINWRGNNKGSYVDDFIPEEYMTIYDGEVGRVTGEYYNPLLDPSRVVQSVKRPQLYDNKHRFVSINPSQYIYTDYFHIPLTLWHKFGGRL